MLKSFRQIVVAVGAALVLAAGMVTGANAKVEGDTIILGSSRVLSRWCLKY